MSTERSRIKTAGVSVEEAKTLISELCLLFYGQGWVSGTGGGISVKASDGQIVMAPSGVQKERMEPDDMFVLDRHGGVKECPVQKAGAKPPKLSECSPLFMAAYELRGAGAVMHSHALESVLATMLDEDTKELHVTNLEMIKGIAGHGYYDDCVIPIIENTARESELEQRLRDTIVKYPKTNAVLVRRHGVYIWGDTWISAKTQAECYHYIFSAAVRMRQMGVDASVPPKLSALGQASKKRSLGGDAAAANGGGKRSKKGAVSYPDPEVVVLDIEGTTTPITFVADKLFPYARDRVEAHLKDTWGENETQTDVEAIRQQAAEDVAAKLKGAATIPAKGKPEAVRAACVKFVKAAIAADRKVPALKGLQGHMWRAGFEAGELVGEVYPDVKARLEAWAAAGVRVYIYSSGSREAQALLFGHSNRGDLRRHLSGYFDPTSTRGTKQEAASYRDIALSVGAAADPGRILFLTDVAAEAAAAREAGWQAALLVRPGNKPLPKGHGIDRVVESFADLYT